MTSAEKLAKAVLADVEDVMCWEEAEEIHEALVGFAKGYEKTREYEFIEAYRNGDPRVKDFAGRVLGTEVVAEAYDPAEETAEKTEQLRIDFG